MSDATKPSRRAFLKGAAAVRRRWRPRPARAGRGPDPLITEVQAWAQGFGDGVDATPYGLPIQLRSRM